MKVLERIPLPFICCILFLTEITGKNMHQGSVTNLPSVLIFLILFVIIVHALLKKISGNKLIAELLGVYLILQFFLTIKLGIRLLKYYHLRTSVIFLPC